jgi:hypothetical protein
MKTTIAGLLVLPFLALDPSPAAAQANRPWCAQYYGSLGGGTNCGFTILRSVHDDGRPGHGRLVRAEPGVSTLRRAARETSTVRQRPSEHSVRTASAV